jgi:hypothetical protein
MSTASTAVELPIDEHSAAYPSAQRHIHQWAFAHTSDVPFTEGCGIGIDLNPARTSEALLQELPERHLAPFWLVERRDRPADSVDRTTNADPNGGNRCSCSDGRDSFHQLPQPFLQGSWGWEGTAGLFASGSIAGDDQCLGASDVGANIDGC